LLSGNPCIRDEESARDADNGIKSNKQYSYYTITASTYKMAKGKKKMMKLASRTDEQEAVASRNNKKVSSVAVDDTNDRDCTRARLLLSHTMKLVSHTITPLRNGMTPQTDGNKNGNSTVTPSQAAAQSKKHSKTALALRRKWPEVVDLVSRCKWEDVAEAMHSPEAHIVFGKDAVKQSMINLLIGIQRPMNITELHKVFTRTVCMQFHDFLSCMASDDPSKKGVLSLLKYGKSADTRLYYVDKTKLELKGKKKNESSITAAIPFFPSAATVSNAGSSSNEAIDLVYSDSDSGSEQEGLDHAAENKLGAGDKSLTKLVSLPIIVTSVVPKSVSTVMKP
jgi:hypothetical protein